MTEGHRPSRLPRRRPVTQPAAVLAGIVAVLMAVAACTSSRTAAGQATGTAPAPAAPATSSAAAPSAAVTSARPAGQDADWPTYDRTADRSGVSISSPAPATPRRSWTTAVDGAVFAQPLVVGSEVIVATENNTVYALDESTGAVRWSRHLASPVPAGLPCGNVDPSGITGTPVADVTSGRLWVVTFTGQPAYRHTLWELDVATGVFSCYDSLRAVQITSGRNGAAPGLHVRWSLTGLSPGPPIIAGGVVWDVGRKGTLWYAPGFGQNTSEIMQRTDPPP